MPTIQVTDQTPEREASDFCFAEQVQELLALPVKRILRVNLDVSRTVSQALGVLPVLKTLRPELEQHAASANFALIDKVELYALTLNFAHGDYCIALHPASAVKTQRAAERLRATLLSSARVWAARGRIPETTLHHAVRRAGFKHLARDLTLLVRTFRNSDVPINEHSLPSEAELCEAQRLETELIRLAHERTHQSLALKRAADLQARAFTLLLHAYREARDAVIWVRRAQGDADKLIPSLYKTKSKRRRKQQPSPSLVTLINPPQTGIN